MNERAFIFVDQHGIGGGGNPYPGGGPHWQLEDEKFWKAGWQGRLPLWKVFWLYFVFGHGIIGGLGCGLIVFGMLFGFAIDGSTLAGGAGGLAVGIGALVIAFTVFAVWSVVSVWRCAPNCLDKRWGPRARAVMVVYGLLLMVPLVNWLLKWGAA